MKKNLKWIILLGFVLIFLWYLWARYISTSGLIVKEYAITDSKLPDAFDGFKVVHFSDIHYGSTVDLKKLQHVVDTINNQNPDIILFTGDFSEGKVIIEDDEIEKIVNILKKLNPKIETLAVIGNHDFESDYFEKITSQLDWKILDNTYEFVYNNDSTPIVFTGFDDLLEGKPNYENAFSFKNEISDELYTIAVMHEPDQIDEILQYDFNLAIASHSHLGQVRLPLIGALWTPKGSKKYYDEHYIVDNRDLYINGGIGESTIYIRFFNKPSISLYRFYTK